MDYWTSANLTGDPLREGFVVLAPQGRNTTHYYPPPDTTGLGWDIWYRQFNPGTVTVGGVAYPENVDFATIDHFVAEAVLSGVVDPARIYVLGWSNGAAAADQYALFRRAIAAAAPYSTGGGAFGDGGSGPYADPCPQTPVLGAPTSDSQIQIPRVGVPIFTIQNNCDIDGTCAPDQQTVEELESLGEAAQDTIIDANQTQVSLCAAACTGPNESLAAEALGVQNHVRWPSDWTGKMLDFLGAQSL
jgi:hypothetical protein